MIIDDKKNQGSGNKIATNQNIVIENRERINISGVYDIINFDEEMVTIDTELRNANRKGI